MGFIVPPGGLAGFSQMTPASKARLSQIPGARRGGKRRKARKTKARASKRRKGGRKIKFGSPAWRKKYKLGKKR